jgi:ABC transport system ATP-binding/permease protein
VNLVTVDGVGRQIGERTLFRDVSLRLNTGDRIGLIGVNGSGKSTLLRIVAGIDAPESGTVTVWGGVRIQYLAQEPTLDPLDRVLDHLLRSTQPDIALLREYRQAADAVAAAPADTARLGRLNALAAEMDRTGAWNADVMARTILSRLGVPDPAAPVTSLSGGMRKRVALAGALLDPADLLILDEPTNHLDADAIAWLEEYLLTVPPALVMVTHDRYFLDRVVNRILELDRRAIVPYPGNYARYLELRAERHERLAAIEQRRQKLLRRELEWLRRAPKARTHKQRARSDRVAELAQIAVDSGDVRVAIALAGRRLGQRVLVARDLHQSYGDVAVLKGIDLDLGPGARIGIIGPNGSGKTTLLDVLAGRLPAERGTVAWGESVELGYFDQTSGALDDNLRVLEFIESRAPVITAQDGQRVTAARMLEWFLFDGAMQHARIGSLSGGERRRLYLLWTLVHRPNVLFLDEPTNDLDVPTLTVLEEFLDHFGGSLVVVSHDRYFLDRTVDELVAIEGGRFAHRYPAPYETFQRLRAEAAAGGVAAPSAGAARAARARPRTDGQAGPRRPTYRDRLELQRIEARIGELEARQAEIERGMVASASDYVRLQALTRAQAEVGAELDDLLARWLALSEGTGG